MSTQTDTNVERELSWWEQLRAPFPEHQIGKLPKINCHACSERAKVKGTKASDRHCDRHGVTECTVCGNFITSSHIHVDYVGHAAVTDRLLQVDPEWTWRPMATQVDTGFPIIDQNGGLWILLTVKGITRPGYGDGKNPKEIIGDAIRNAAMRFGVAIDVWSKESLTAEPPPADEQRRSKQRDPQTPSQKTINAARVAVLKRAIDRAELDEDAVSRIVEAVTGQTEVEKITLEHYDQVVSEVRLAGDGAGRA